MILLSLLRNPITTLKHYRLYTIYKMPNLRVLDFKKIKQKEKQEATKLFKGKKLKQSETAKPKTFVPGEPLKPVQPQQRQLTKEEIERIKVSKAFLF